MATASSGKHGMAAFRKGLIMTVSSTDSCQRLASWIRFETLMAVTIGKEQSVPGVYPCLPGVYSCLGLTPLAGLRLGSTTRGLPSKWTPPPRFRAKGKPNTFNDEFDLFLVGVETGFLASTWGFTPLCLGFTPLALPWQITGVIWFWGLPPWVGFTLEACAWG